MNFNIKEVPELILHPLSKRPSENVIVQETDSLDSNYKLVKKIPYNEEILLKLQNQYIYWGKNQDVT